MGEGGREREWIPRYGLNPEDEKRQFDNYRTVNYLSHAQGTAGGGEDGRAEI